VQNLKQRCGVVSIQMREAPKFRPVSTCEEDREQDEHRDNRAVT